MASVFQKLNLKEQSEIVVLGAPESFEPELGSLPAVRVVRDAQDAREINFALCFVTSPGEVQAAALSVLASMQGDALLWFAYPKGTSHTYKSTINRDHGWDVLGSAGWVPVRQVAIDDDWSALRFRRSIYVKRT